MIHAPSWWPAAARGAPTPLELGLRAGIAYLALVLHARARGLRAWARAWASASAAGRALRRTLRAADDTPAGTAAEVGCGPLALPWHALAATTRDRSGDDAARRAPDPPVVQTEGDAPARPRASRRPVRDPRRRAWRLAARDPGKQARGPDRLIQAWTTAEMLAWVQERRRSRGIERGEPRRRPRDVRRGVARARRRGSRSSGRSSAVDVSGRVSP